MGSPEQIAYQHTVLCQTSLPYRNPGPDVRVWEKRQGGTRLRIEAGATLTPDTGEFVQLGLPFGPKPRLILAHLNAEALKTRSPEINVGDSLTAFVRRIQNYRPNGKELCVYKDQLGRLSAATIRMAMTTHSHAAQINSQIVVAFEFWFPKNERQRIVWPSILQLGNEYFLSLQNHAVPLDERALAGLAHSALALDIYAWLAQRLHRVPSEKPQLVSWAVLKEQFGTGHKRMDHFKHNSRVAISQVLAHYPAAKIEGSEYGLILHNSPPPVKKRLVLVRQDPR